MSEIRLAVIDNYPIFRAGLIYVLGAELDLKVVGEGSSVDDALRLVREAKPSLIVLDMSIPGGGITAIESVLACCPDVKPLMLTSIVDNDQVCSAMQKGAWGYVPKGIMAVPLLVEERALGVLSVLDRPTDSKFTLAEMNLLGLFANQAAIALDLLQGGRRAQAVLEGDGELGALARIAATLETADDDKRAAGLELLSSLERLLR